MAAPLNLEEGQSSHRPPRFNGHFNSWWKVRMHDYLMAEDNELWDIVLDGPFVPMMKEKDGEKTITVPKPRQKYDEADRKKIEKGPDEYNRVSACESAKEIWGCLKTAHKGTEQVKESKIDMRTSRYENFKMKEGETIHDLFTKFSSITNELRSLGEPISMTKQVRKVLRILPKSWESKVDAITEAKDLKVLTMDALIGNLKTHEMNRNYDLSKKEAKKDKSLMLKYKSDEDSSDDDDMALAAWGDSSSDSEDPDEPKDMSMVAMYEEETLNQITEEAEKLNGMSNSLQAEIQEKLKNSEKNLGLSLEKSNKLEHDIVKLKEEREKSLKWTKSSKLLSNTTNQNSIDNVYHVDGLKYSLLSVSEICDKGNEVKFTSEKCTVVSLTTNKKSEGGEVDADQQVNNGCDDQNHSLPDEAAEGEKDDMVPGTTQNSSQSTSDSPEDDVTLDEEEHADQPSQSAPRWVFRNKLDENGVITRNKSRMEAIRILIAFAAFMGFKLYTFSEDLLNKRSN
nr:uncharacterized protein LOC112942064 [Solanum lycopersicum]